MCVIDCLRSLPSSSWDPASWISPQNLKMVFTATLIVSVVAALFAAYALDVYMALPFLACAGAAYLCKSLVDRHLIYAQAMERHSEAISGLTGALRAAELALGQSRQQAETRQQQNGALQANVERLELALQADAQAAQTFAAQLDEERQRGVAQNAELSRTVERLTEQNAQTRAAFEEQIASAVAINELLRQDIETMQRLQAQQQVLNAETHQQTAGAREAADHVHQRGSETAEVVDRIASVASETVDLQQRAIAQGEKLLELRRRIEAAQ